MSTERNPEIITVAVEGFDKAHYKINCEVRESDGILQVTDAAGNPAEKDDLTPDQIHIVRFLARTVGTTFQTKQVYEVLKGDGNRAERYKKAVSDESTGLRPFLNGVTPYKNGLWRIARRDNTFGLRLSSEFLEEPPDPPAVIQSSALELLWYGPQGPHAPAMAKKDIPWSFSEEEGLAINQQPLPLKPSVHALLTAVKRQGGWGTMPAIEKTFERVATNPHNTLRDFERWGRAVFSMCNQLAPVVLANAAGPAYALNCYNGVGGQWERLHNNICMANGKAITSTPENINEYLFETAVILHPAIQSDKHT